MPRVVRTCTKFNTIQGPSQVQAPQSQCHASELSPCIEIY